MLEVKPPQSEAELLTRAQALSGLSLGELARRFNLTVPRQQLYAKGWVGELLELELVATAGSRPEPDFPHLGVELKTLPLNHDGKPRESTFVCSISLNNTANTCWETSLVWRKLRRVLWIPIEAAPNIPLAQRRICTPLLWSPSYEQEKVLRTDWQELSDMICFGQLADITAKLGRYLQIRPKAAHAKSLCWGVAETGEPTLTLPRGFYLRSAFTGSILQQYFAMG
jgi:DNA mismatch repair protein MutH